MTISSSYARLRARGAMTEREFLASMAKAGFVITDPMPDCLWTFTHEKTGPRRYPMRNGETFRATLDRLTTMLRNATAERAT